MRLIYTKSLNVYCLLANGQDMVLSLFNVSISALLMTSSEGCIFSPAFNNSLLTDSSLAQ